VLRPSRYTLFETAIGTCAVAFTARGISMVGLPEVSRAVLCARFDARADRLDGAVPAVVQQAIDAIAAHLDGDLRDLSALTVDLQRLAGFDARVYELTGRIPAGRTRTYGDLAAELGGPGMAQAVGQSLGRNPVPLIVPCHRVVRAGGEPGGFSAAGGTALKLRLLALEGAGGPQLGMNFD
jgi:methylated-DNA-[protein]-cysteine S-methyltransferase